MFLRCEVTGGMFDGENWTLESSRGPVVGRHVINCAGLYGDRLDAALLGSAAFKITPGKGQFVVFDKAAAKLARSIILPVPTSRTKGVVICRTVIGSTSIGQGGQDRLQGCS